MELTNEAPQGFCGDVAVSLLVIYSESVFKFPLHGLHVGVLHQEGGAQLTELSELDLAGAVLVNLSQEVLQLLLRGPEAHGSHDLTQIISREKVDLLGVEEIKTRFKTLDLVRGQSGALGDVVELNPGVRIVVSHDDDAH